MPVLTDLIKVFDIIIGRPLCAAAGVAVRATHARHEASAKPPRRILVIRPGGIGDAVLFVPLLQELRRAWPRSELDLLAERRNAGVVEGTGLVDHVWRYDRFPRDLWTVIRRGYDLVVDTEQYHCLSALVAAATGAPRRIGFDTNGRRALFTTALPYSQDAYETRMFLELAEAATGLAPAWDLDRPFYPVPVEAAAFAREALAPLDGRRIVAIHPGASIPERRWPVERYAALARMLAQDGLGIVVVGGTADVDTGEQILAALDRDAALSLAGRTSLQNVAAIIARAAVYVSGDTGPLHLAYAVGTPTVHFFGAGVLAKWGPPGKRYTAIAANVPCSPCTVYGYTPPCCQGLRCLLEISPEQVCEAVRRQLQQSDAGRLENRP